MNSSISNPALKRRSPAFCMAVILGLQAIGFAPVVAWCVLSRQLPIEAVCVATMLVAALNAVGVVCLAVANDRPTRSAPLSTPWWIVKNRALINA